MQKLAALFYEAARECDLGDADKVEEILGIPKQISEPIKETDEGEFDSLTNKQIFSLAAAITLKDMIVFAENYLNISEEIIEALQYENRWDVEGFNRDILRHWASKNSRRDQLLVGSFHILTLFKF